MIDLKANMKIAGLPESMFGRLFPYTKHIISSYIEFHGFGQA